MQEPVLEPRFQEVVRDIAEGGDVPGIPVRDEPSATHESPSGQGPGTPAASAIPGCSATVVSTRCTAGVTRRGPSEQVRPASRAGS